MSAEQYARWSRFVREVEPMEPDHAEHAEYGDFIDHPEFDDLLDGLDPFAEDVSKHMGPGPHPDGTPQSVHAGAPRLFEMEGDPEAEMVAAAERFWSQDTLDIDAATPPPPPASFDAEDMATDISGLHWRYSDHAFDLDDGRDFTVLGVPGRGQVSRGVYEYLSAAGPHYDDPVGRALRDMPAEHPDFREEAFVVKNTDVGEEQLLLYRKGKDSSSVAFNSNDLDALRFANIYHTHPTTSPLSTADITFAVMANAKSMTAFGIEGLHYRMDLSNIPLDDMERRKIIGAITVIERIVQGGLGLWRQQASSAGGYIGDPGYMDSIDAEQFQYVGGHIEQHIFNEALARYMPNHFRLNHNADDNAHMQRLRDAINYDRHRDAMWSGVEILMESMPADIRAMTFDYITGE